MQAILPPGFCQARWIISLEVLQIFLASGHSLSDIQKVTFSVPKSVSFCLNSFLSVLDVPLHIKVPSFIHDSKTLFALASLLLDQEVSPFGQASGSIL